MNKYALVVRNEAQKILFDEELMGQLSDGMWENTRPFDHWKVWADCDVVVAGPDDEVGRTFYAAKSNYNFTSRDLLDVVGDRMLEYVQQVDPSYTKERMLEDLKDLKQIVRKERPVTPADKKRLQAAYAEEDAARKAAEQAKKDRAQRIRDAAEKHGVDMYVSDYSDTLRYSDVVKLLDAAGV